MNCTNTHLYPKIVQAKLGCYSHHSQPPGPPPSLFWPQLWLLCHNWSITTDPNCRCCQNCCQCILGHFSDTASRSHFCPITALIASAVTTIVTADFDSTDWDPRWTWLSANCNCRREGPSVLGPNSDGHDWCCHHQPRHLHHCQGYRSHQLASLGEQPITRTCSGFHHYRWATFCYQFRPPPTTV